MHTDNIDTPPQLRSLGRKQRRRICGPCALLGWLNKQIIWGGKWPLGGLCEICYTTLLLKVVSRGSASSLYVRLLNWLRTDHPQEYYLKKIAQMWIIRNGCRSVGLVYTRTTIMPFSLKKNQWQQSLRYSRLHELYKLAGLLCLRQYCQLWKLSEQLAQRSREITCWKEQQFKVPSPLESDFVWFRKNRKMPENIRKLNIK